MGYLSWELCNKKSEILGRGLVSLGIALVVLASGDWDSGWLINMMYLFFRDNGHWPFYLLFNLLP